jgi:hypothetical protein
MRSTLVGWIKDAALSWPAAILLAGMFGATGVIYGQAAAGVVAGLGAAIWGWIFVAGLGPEDVVDAPPPRPYPNPDRYRIR